MKGYLRRMLETAQRIQNPAEAVASANPAASGT